MEKTSVAENKQNGKILRVKHGYNPNSSSMGSIVFALPVSLLGITAAFGAVSGVIMTAFLKDKNKSKQTSENSPDSQKDADSKGQ